MSDTGRDTGFRLLGRSLRARRRELVFLGFWSAVEALPAMASGLCMARAVDRGFLAGDLATGLWWLAGVLAAYAVGAVASRFTYPLLGAVIEPLRDDLLRAVVAGLVHGPEGVLPDGASTARVTQQVESVRRTVTALLNGLRRFVFTTAAAVFGLGALAGEVVWVTIPPVILSAALFGLLLPSLARRQRATLAAGERVSADAAAAFAGHRDIAAFGRAGQVTAEVGAAMAAERHAQQRMARALAARSVVTAIGGYLPLLSLIAATPWLLGRGLTVGLVIGAATYLTMHLDPAMKTLTDLVGGSGLQLSVTLGRLTETIRATPGSPPAATPAPATAEVRAERLTFAYDPNAEPVLRDLSFHVPDGSHLAVIGPSGIGKSTLAVLLAGLGAPGDGLVTVGGRPPVRDHVALLPQESYVFTGTVRDNLRYLNPEAADADLLDAVRAVGADFLLNGGLNGGLDDELDPGALSLGQRQLVALARAHASRARLVVLDEATCHLDPAAEARAERAFRGRPGTLVVIAHRAASALRADEILLLDGARAWFGRHETLVAASPLYAELVGAQASPAC
ncbi:ATP-binding cassette domain-containing protein [Herbidospora cretacea]|uniref:ATP-binding cassette domain-containing protein n=1 Tax=Herbidospora cretacea TaxID=28444 RepID=UPI00068FDFC9|nr:ABC transporter ATP-binding protein [Herbidospora cretacea]